MQVQALYLIEKSFRKLVKIPGPGEFWRSIIRHYGKDVKLDDNKMRYIVRARRKGERASDITRNVAVSKMSISHDYGIMSHMTGFREC